MVVDFTIENFRSIKEKQMFSMYADKKPLHHAGNITYIDDEIGLLKTAAIYGANASGKTNLILAFETIRSLVVKSGDWKDGDRIAAYEPYLLSQETIKAPTRFDMEFYVGKDRYQYQVEFDAYNILFEKLDLFKTAKASNIFVRSSATDWKSVKFGDSYKGGRKQFAFFANNTYLSKAGNSPESPRFIRDVYSYFRKNINTVLAGQMLGVLDWENKPGFKNVANTFLKKADLGIESFDFKEGELPNGFVLPGDIPSDIKETIMRDILKKEVFYHTSESGPSVEFSREMESRGTVRLLRLIPVFTLILMEGSLLLIDEIESSLHPHIAELVIKLFNDPLVNVNNAQLIFTTHDLSLMSQNMLRKDQVYLSSKSPMNGTKYSCLDEFDSALKDSSPFAKWYNEGRLGNIPEINYKDISDSIKEALNNA